VVYCMRINATIPHDTRSRSMALGGILCSRLASARHRRLAAAGRRPRRPAEAAEAEGSPSRRRLPRWTGQLVGTTAAPLPAAAALTPSGAAAAAFTPSAAGFRPGGGATAATCRKGAALEGEGGMGLGRPAWVGTACRLRAAVVGATGSAAQRRQQRQQQGGMWSRMTPP
jgi:hypothetical protein